MKRLRHASKVSLLLVLVFLSGPASAAPSHQDPDAPLAVRPEQESRTLETAAAAVYQKARPAVAEFQQKLDGNQLDQVKPIAIGQAHVAVSQLARLAHRLIIRGEPAGEDFRLRAEELKRQLGPIIEAYRRLPGVAEQISRDYSILRREAQAKAAVLPKVKQLIDREEYEQAESALREAIDELETKCVWYSGQQRRMLLGDFLGPLASVESRLRRLREERVRAALAEARGALCPNFDAMLAQIRDAAASLRTTGSAPLEGESLSGPELLERFGGQWQDAQHQAVRCLGLDWAQGLDATTRERTELIDQQARFSSQIGPALAALIESDAARTGESDAPGLFVAYLERLAPLVARSGDDALARAVATALQNLAAKSPQFHAEVQAYRQATAGVLRWRRRTAQAYARARQPEYPPVAQQLLGAVQQLGSAPGLVPAGSADTSRAEFSSPVPSVMRPAVDRLMGQRVTLIDLVGLATEPKVLVARYRQRHYARFALPQESAERLSHEIAALQSDLLVGPSAPPLSLEAAVALWKARQGDLEAAGGEVSGMVLEPLLTRFATLPSAGRAVIPLGPLPQEPGSAVVLRQVLMQVEIAPAWIRHECFFVELK